MGPAQNNTAIDASSIPLTAAPGNVPNQANNGNMQVMNGQNQQPNLDGEGKVKKKVQFQGRGRGIGVVPKGRGSATPGWTGAGFDVDGRS